PAVSRVVTAATSVKIDVRVRSTVTGPVADERNGTNDVAPAYDGHAGALFDSPLAAANAEAIAPSATPSVSATLRFSRPPGDHAGTAPPMSAIVADCTARLTTADASSTAS